MKQKKQTLLFIFLGLTFLSYNFIVVKNPGLLVTVSTNKVYYEIGEPILISLTITNPTILILRLRFMDSNRVDYKISQNNQTLYQDDGEMVYAPVSDWMIMPLTTRTYVINHTSTEYFLKGGMYQITVTLVRYCSKTTYIYVGMENQEVG